MATNGIRLFVSSLVGFSNWGLLSLLYTLIVSAYSYICEKDVNPISPQLKRCIYCFAIFMICSMLFSNFYYGLEWKEIQHKVSTYFIFLSYIFIRKSNIKDFESLVKCIYYVTLIHSILYIIQVVTGLAVLPYHLEVRADDATGIERYYNFPYYLNCAILLLILCSNYINLKFKNASLIIFIGATILTLGRTYMAGTVLAIIFGLYIQGRLQSKIRYLLILLLVLIPASSIFTSRMSNSGIEDDLKAIFSGNFVNGYNQEGTMTYRFAWMAERSMYMLDEPVGVSAFGLGFMSETIAGKYYNFFLGLTDPETGDKEQISTPDIAYGNILTRFGFCGGLLYLAIWILLFVQFFRLRKDNDIAVWMIAYLAFLFFDSFAGEEISVQGLLILPYVALSTISRQNNYQKHENFDYNN